MSKGKVFLIGAGLGDPELITLKAAKSLAACNVVLVDDLVNPEILNHCPKARVVNVGKRGGCKSTSQHFINRMMIALAEQGQIVARLKGGDPFLFGRGGEEMLALRKAIIDYEVIPGITAGIGATASMEVPITHRDYTHGATFITGHTQDETPIQWRALVASKTTLVIYMGIANLAEITRNLLKADMPKDTPAMIIENGSLVNERAITTTLEYLPFEAFQQKMQSPSIIIVGNVVTLAKDKQTLISEKNVNVA
jgi:uroporphyrin-III C-methyltransferase